MSPRLRLWLLFGCLAVVTTAVLAWAVWAAGGRAWLLAPAWFAIVAVQAAIWLYLDQRWVQPSTALAREVDLLVRAKAARAMTPPGPHGLGPLPDAIDGLVQRWQASERDQAAAVEDAMAGAALQQARLEALLRDLSDGVIACSVDRRILLFNDAAMRILGSPVELGLDRPLDRLIAQDPVALAFERLCTCWTGQTDPIPREEFTCATADDGRLLRCRMAPILGQGREIDGFMLDFRPVAARSDDVVPAGEPRVEPTAPLPPRPEFHDLTILAQQRERAAPLLERPLGTLTYVVFDTETTGLDPQHDRIIQIAGVRIVNRRLLSGETFEALVHPGRPIGKASMRFHGISDAMVADKPPISTVLPWFHRYAHDAVLVAHNAAFDMAFLHRAEEVAGVTFDHPVLDTLLLSSVLHDHTPDHTLDAIAARFGIPLVDRHTALGDAMGTARILLRMLDLLEAAGVTTLGATLAACARASALRRRQRAQFGDRKARSGRPTS